MGKYLDWIKRNIINEKNNEKTDKKGEYKVEKIEKGENVFKTTTERPKEKIFISHMDDLFWDAGKIVVKNNKASTGMLQMLFKINFVRASAIMDELCEAGIVGEYLGTKPRKILITYKEFEELRTSNGIEVGKLYISNNKDDSQKTNSFMPDRVGMYNNKYDYMTGEDFEIFVAQILSKIDFYNIKTTKGSGDQGVDIIAERDSIKYAFQCKRYDKPVGNKAVQEVFAGKFFYHCHAAIVVTNNYFTQSAKELANENGVVLWDRDYIENILHRIGISSGYKNETRNNEENIESFEEISKYLKEIAVKISNVFKSFQINIPIVNIEYGKNKTVFWIQPQMGIRIKTVLSYKQEIEFELKMPIQMKVVSEKGWIGIYVSSKDLCEYARGNKKKKEEKTQSQNVPDSIIERHYYINGEFATFSLKKKSKIEILAICENGINAANLYFSYSVKLKEEWIGKINFAVVVNFGNAMAIYTNENKVEFFGGKELDGEIAIGIPKWMDKARDELLSGNEEEFLRMVEEANEYLDGFMEEAIKYIE